MKTINSVLLGLVVLAQGGCSQSPLFNHAEANTQPAVNHAQIKLACPILFEKEKICASLTWNRMPTEEDKGDFSLRFWNQEQATENGPYSDPGKNVFVKLWMPSMGHGSSPVTTLQEKDSGGQVVPGVFHATEVYFVMPGAWQILIQLKQDKQVIDQAIYDVTI